MQVLDQFGVSDIADMEKKKAPGTPPRLVIVADEFAVLANKSNSTGDDVIDEIVNIARLGRKSWGSICFSQPSGRAASSATTFVPTRTSASLCVCRTRRSPTTLWVLPTLPTFPCQRRVVPL